MPAAARHETDRRHRAPSPLCRISVKLQPLRRRPNVSRLAPRSILTSHLRLPAFWVPLTSQDSLQNPARRSRHLTLAVATSALDRWPEIRWARAVVGSGHCHREVVLSSQSRTRILSLGAISSAIPSVTGISPAWTGSGSKGQIASSGRERALSLGSWECQPEMAHRAWAPRQ